VSAPAIDAAPAAPASADVAATVRQLEIRSRHLVKDILAGEYSSVFKGRGVEFSDVREYQHGDDVRTIDWRVTARMDAAYVRRYVDERELTVLFMVDQSASDAFGSRLRSKAQLGTELCAVLAMTAVRNNDRVGAAIFTDRVEHFVSPNKGKRHVLRVIRELLAFRPTHAGTDLGAALEVVNRVLRRRAVLFIVSDWLTSGYDTMLERTARRHDTIAVQLVDPRERELPDVGLITIRDAESGEWRVIDSGDPTVRQELAQQAAQFDAALAQRLRRSGVDLIRLHTDRGYVAPLLAFFRRRERLRRH